MKYSVRFEDETIKEAISSHLEGGYISIESAKDDTFIYESAGTKFEVINQHGYSEGHFVVTSKGTKTTDCFDTKYSF